MKTFKASAEVVNIYGNSENLIDTIYKAESKEKALQGFTDYLKSNRNLIYFNNVKVIEV